MSFKQLYEHVCKAKTLPIDIHSVVLPLVCELSGQDDIRFYEVDIDPRVCRGMMKKYREPTGVYADSKWITEIRFHRELNLCWRRIVWCKELIHLFDNSDEITNTREKFTHLLDEMTKPVNAQHAHPSAMHNSEYDALGKALAILCPLPARQIFFKDWKSGNLDNYQIALTFRIPEFYVEVMMSPIFEEYVTQITK